MLGVFGVLGVSRNTLLDEEEGEGRGSGPHDTSGASTANTTHSKIPDSVKR